MFQDPVPDPRSVVRRIASFDQLVPGTRYQFRVRAETIKGYGPFANEVVIQTLGSHLGKPIKLSLYNQEPTRLFITWKPPMDSEAITSYVVHYAQAIGPTGGQARYLSKGELGCQQEEFGVQDDDTLCYTITDLTPSTLYTIKVQAVDQNNAKGTWSEELPARTADSEC